MNHTVKGDVLIIGAGIVGLSTAYYLLESGWKVTVLEKGDARASCSIGNAGMIVPSHFTPLAAPGIVAQGIRWMFNKRSPFYLKPSLSPDLLSWGIKFLKHATARHVAQAAPSILQLNLLGKQTYEALAQQQEFAFGLEEKGILMLCKQEKTLEEETALARQAAQLGIDCKVLDPEQLKQAEPEVHLDVAGAVHYTCDAHLSPPQLIEQLISAVRRRGGVLLEHSPVRGIERSANRITAVLTEKGRHTADAFVLSPGAWLGKLAGKAGLPVPLMPGKGYSFMTDAFEGKLRLPALLMEERVSITPMNGRVRVGGTMELAGVNNKINLAKVEGIVRAVPKYYPAQKLSMPAKEEIWYGFRPCSPDGLPYLGRSRKLNNLLLAGGAGMMGLSTGPAMGKLISELINEEPTSLDLTAFTPERFS